MSITWMPCIVDTVLTWNVQLNQLRILRDDEKNGLPILQDDEKNGLTRTAFRSGGLSTTPIYCMDAKPRALVQCLNIIVTDSVSLVHVYT